MAKLKEEWFGGPETEPYLPPALKILKQKKAIREALEESRNTGKVVGIYTPVLGPGMFLVCVHEVTTEKDEIVFLKPYDMNGILLEKNELRLSQIKSVCPFESYYVNPMDLNWKQFA